MRIGVFGALVAALLVTACSESTAPSGGGLTRNEALAFATGLAEVDEETYPGTEQEMMALDGEARSISIERERQRPCQVSGFVARALTAEIGIDRGSRTLDYHAAGSVTHQACTFVAGGVTLTVDGEPNIAFDGRLTAENGNVGPYSVTYDGRFGWAASDGRDGHCVVDLDAVTNFVDRQRTVTGTVCGHSVQRIVSLR